MRVVKIKNISGETKTLNAKEFTNNEEYTIQESSITMWQNDNTVDAINSDEFQIGDGESYISSHIGQIDWLVGATPQKVQPLPFADKTGYIFNGRGTTQQVTASSTTNINYTIPTGTFDMDGVTLVNTENMDKATMKVLDDSSGTYSGTANAVLNTFATDWNTVKDKCSEMMPYPARVYTGMVIRVEYTETNGNAKTIGMNIRLHKVV